MLPASGVMWLEAPESMIQSGTAVWLKSWPETVDPRSQSRETAGAPGTPVAADMLVKTVHASWEEIPATEGHRRGWTPP